MAKQHSILDILNGCHKKQAKYQRALVDQYSGYLLATCKRYLNDDEYAKDLVQESLVRIFKNLDSYNPKKGSFPSWITTIAIRLCLTKLRKKRVQFVSIESSEEPELIEGNSEMILDKMESAYLIRMVRELPDSYRVVFNMSAIDGFSHREIAEQLDITEEASRSRLTRARCMLKTKINHLNKQELWVNSI